MSEEHPLITNPDNRVELILPEDTYPSHHGLEDKIDGVHVVRKRAANKVKEAIELDSLDDAEMSFVDYGHIDLKIRHGGERKLVRIKIKTIPHHKLEEYQKQYQKAFLSIKRTWNPEMNNADGTKGGWDIDPNADDYAEQSERLITLNRELLYDKVLEGLNMTLKHKGAVIWNPDDDTPESQNREKAIAWFHRVGIQKEQLDAISEAIDELSARSQMADDEDFLKNSTQP